MLASEIDYSELITEEREELPESWDDYALPVVWVDEETFDCGDSMPLNFD
jgi:hypothetical protein